MQQASPIEIVAHGDMADNVRSFARHLRARNVSPRTIETYIEAGRQLAAFLQDRGMPGDVAKIKQEHVEAFIADLLDRKHENGQPYKAATAHNRYRGLKSFFAWLVDQREIRTSPMDKMMPPRMPEPVIPVLKEPELKRLLATVEKGRTFDERRDYAIMRVFIATGARLSEVAALRWEPDDPFRGDPKRDVNLDAGLIVIEHGKGDRARVVALDPKTILAIDRYLVGRKKHPRADVPFLWLGRKGAFGTSGIGQMIRDRGRQAGISNVHPHQLRHSVVHRQQAKGMSETALMEMLGWKTREMLDRYAKATRAERAIDEQRKLMIGDDL